MGVFTRTDIRTFGGARCPGDIGFAPTGAERRPNRYEHGAVCEAKRGAHDVRGTSVLRRPERSVDGNTG